ncbi:MAG: asparagine synthase (glutamine-hydrolyzing) [Alphaproteobacteria bacterium]|nr:asparagine synthase (glutamine-hydrolyzing) [Alphaproteobacteria bacterium]
MCGIAGLMALESRARDGDPASTAQRMAAAIAHRGPDGDGAWGDAEAGIGFGHRRLAIIDLTPSGAQPMQSADGRYVIAYNGEVYNFLELRHELKALGHTFRGTSDTEVMLAACVQWGPEAAVSRFVGMFAIALFDRGTRTLRLIRDRLGVKPLYWTVMDGTLLFGSELRALMSHPAFRRDVDREAVAAVVRYSYVPAPATIFRGVFKLPAGSVLTVRPGCEPSIASYWRLPEIAAREGLRIAPAEALDRLDALIRDAVRLRMISDVPIGAFLSGGTDSSAVVALMQSVSSRPVRTFTVGFQDEAYDEAKFARNVARHLATNHTEVTLGPKAVLDLVADIANWFDEPFADSSQLPTYLVASTTRRHVTVSLSGDGGDELFGGYPKYAMLESLWRRAGFVPHSLRATLGKLLGALPERVLRAVAAASLETGRAERIGEKARRLGEALAAASPDAAALAVATVGLDPRGIVRGVGAATAPDPAPDLDGHVSDLKLRMQIRDMMTYLPDDILTKVDRCSMAVALEAREPLLDHRLVEFVLSLPADIRRGDGRPKALLRQVLDRYVPRAMTDRPKRGFSVPLGEWLKGPLRGWAGDLLAPEAMKRENLFDAQRVQSLWQRHLSGTENNATGLWNILMVRAWTERWQTGGLQ